MPRPALRGTRRALGPGVRRQLALSRAALVAERLARCFWPAFAVICLTVAFALFGGFVGVGPWTHDALRILAGTALVASLAWGIWRFRPPSRAAARDRLDRTDPARPLATIDDALATGTDNEWTRAVWFSHLRRAENAARALRSARPDLRLAWFDHWALRIFAPVLMVAAFVGVGDGWRERLSSVMEPPARSATSPVGFGAPLAEAWVTPPAYTGREVIYLSGDKATGPEAVSVPADSEIVIRVTDSEILPSLTAPGLAWSEEFTDYGAGLSEARGELAASGEVVVTAGPLEARWQFNVIPDEPPTISMPAPPRGTLQGSLEVVFEARDDYGVTAAWAEIVPEGHDPATPAKGLSLEPITFALPLPITGDPREIADETLEDFSEHPWAGAKVQMYLFAEDGAGQQTRTGPFTFILPGRRFTHPLARALIEQRRELALDFGQAARVLDVLQAVTRRPEAVFEANHSAYLGTRTAIRRLAHAIGRSDVPATAPGVIEFLWLAALELEDGDLSSALDRLRTAERNLRDALENGSEEDIARAIDELRQAMQNYLQEMARQALEQQNQQNQSDSQPQQQGQQLTQQDLNEMLDELQRRAESGLRDQARDLLSELSRMLENLQAQNQRGGQQQGGAGQTMQQLQELIERQRGLSDRTFGEMQRQRRGENQGREGQGDRNGQGQPGQGQQPGQGPGFGDGSSGDRFGRGQGQGQPGLGGDLAGEQEALRRLLDELAGRLPGGPGAEDIRRALEDAGRAMGRARDDLSEGENAQALEDQMEALDRLNEGAGELAQQMQNGQGDVRALGEGRGRGDGRDADDLDPFDRPTGSYGAIDGRSTGVPDRALLDRARELLNELRRRSGETFRPELELEYLDRLIDQF